MRKGREKEVRERPTEREEKRREKERERERETSMAYRKIRPSVLFSRKCTFLLTNHTAMK